MYPKTCSKCGTYNLYPYIERDMGKKVEVCNNCKKPFPVEKAKPMFAMKDSAGIVR